MNSRNLGSGALTLESIRAAHARIRDTIHRTPVMTSEVLDGMAGKHLYFKCENLQKVGAFKARGATNAVLLLTDAEALRGVVTHSSGNHAAALARAQAAKGTTRGMLDRIVPDETPYAGRKLSQREWRRSHERQKTLKGFTFRV